MVKIEAGDTLCRPKGIVTHVGIAMPNGMVYHNAPGRGEHISTFKEFANGKVVQVRKPKSSVRSVIMQRLDKEKNISRKYSAFGNNCEHSVSRINNGTPSSPQLIAGMIIGGFALYQLLKAK